MEKRRLFKAIRRRNLSDVIEWIVTGENLNRIRHHRMTPLIYAIDCCHKNRPCRGYDDIILCLINAGASVNVRHPRNLLTALMLAIENKRSDEVVRQLINAGSDINAECAQSKTALIYAIENRCSKDMIAELINKGANVNKPSRGFTPLYCALTCNTTIEIVELLINAGADVHVRDWFGRSLLILPCRNKCEIDSLCEHKEMIDLLIKRGVDIKQRDKKGNTIIHEVTCNYLIYMALKNGVSIETKNNEDLTALHQSLVYSEEEKVKDLLLFNADPNCVDLQCNTPLHNNEIMGSESLDSILLYHGANLLIKNINDLTPLSMVLNEFNEFSVFECDDGIKIMIQHYLLFINETDLDEEFNKFDNDNRTYFMSYIDSCKAELRDMRCTCIKEELPFYDFCHLKKLYRSKYVRISVDEYKYCYDQIRDLFPIYQDLIITRINDNSKKKFKHDMIKNLEKISVKPLCSCGAIKDVKLVYDCWYKLGQYLNYKQLYNLFLASLED